jgi:hypothetical protein|tara:strand:- start:886 stop:1056 length:171 start_codon:yes stop_codon:yes gene_type:complete
MNIPTDALVMTVVLIVGFIYFKMQKKAKRPDEEENTVINLNNLVKRKRKLDTDEEE